MVRLGDQDAAEAGQAWLARPVEELELVEALQVECEAAGRAVQLDPQAVLVAGRLPGRLERAQRPRGEPR